MSNRLIIADDSDLLLLGVRHVVEPMPEVTLLDEARSGAALMDACERWQPQVILFSERLDVSWDVLSINQRLQTLLPYSLRLVMGSLADGYLIRDLFNCGVRAYLYTGDVLSDCLPAALRHVLRQHLYLSPTANSEYLIAMRSPERDWQLDAQSRRVLRQLAYGQHVGEIATEMGLSTRQVYWIRQKLRRRFHAQTNEQLVIKAIAEGFAKVPE